MVTSLGEESWSICFSILLVFFSSSWCRGSTAACDCGTPGTFNLTVTEAPLVHMGIEIDVAYNMTVKNVKTSKKNISQV